MADKSGKDAPEFDRIKSELSSYWHLPKGPRRSDSGFSVSSGGDSGSRSASPALTSSSKPRKKDGRPKNLGRQASHRRDYSKDSIDALSSATSNPQTPIEPNPPPAPPATSTAPEPRPSTTRMSSQRNRNARGPNNRSSGAGGEEMLLWQQAQQNIASEILPGFNNNTDVMRQILAQDKHMANSKSATSAEKDAGDRKLDDLFRKGVKSSEVVSEKLKQTIETLQILSAIQKNKEEEEERKAGSTRSSGLGGGSSRGANRAGREREKEKEKEKERKEESSREKEKEKEKLEKEKEKEKEKEREKEKEKERENEKEKEKEKDKEKEKESTQKTNTDLYDVENMDDSSLASPAPNKPTNKLGASSVVSDRSGNRDSVPPRGTDRDTSAKADSVEPQPQSQLGGSSAAQRSKITFVKGQDVIFRPKPQSPNESTEWFLGKVQQVLGEGKSRRYKVKDEDPDLAPDQRQEYRTSASSMIPLPPVTAELPDLEKGRTVLALYPDSTTFYKAEVMGTDKDTGRVSLRFEGEENSGTLQAVERRFVVEYRN